jgi:negative regulator of sigma E activity
MRVDGRGGASGYRSRHQSRDENPKELLEATRDGARRETIAKKQAADRVKQNLEKMSREGLLPYKKTLQRVARYEAQFS